MAKLQFGRSMLSSLANPNFGNIEGLGRQIGSAQAMAQEAERQKEFDANAFKLFRQGLFSVDEGDVAALSDSASGLADLLVNTRDEKDRAVLQDYITQLDAQRTATETKATTNTAESIIKTEQALEKLTSEMDTISGPLAPPQQKVFDALTQRLGVMKQNSKAVIEADDIKYQARFKKIRQENEIADQQKQAVQRRLSSVPFESDQYKELAQEARNANQGQAVDQYEKLQFGLIEARAKADDIRDSEKPLSQEEIERLETIGVKVPKNQTRLSIKANRESLAKLEEITETRRITMALRNVEGVEDVKAHVETTLQTFMDRGDLPANFLSSDLYNKIKDLFEDKDEMARFVGTLERPAGKELSRPEIEAEVQRFLLEKFPNEFKDMLRYEENQRNRVDRINFLTLDLMAQKGLATRNDDGTITLNEGVTRKQILPFQREVEYRTGLTGMAIDALTPSSVLAGKDDPNREVDIYSPTF